MQDAPAMVLRDMATRYLQHFQPPPAAVAMHDGAPLVYRLDLTLLASASPPLYGAVTEFPPYALALFAAAIRTFLLAGTTQISDGDDDATADAQSFQEHHRAVASLSAVVAALPIHVTIKSTALGSALREAAFRACYGWIGNRGVPAPPAGRTSGSVVGGWFVPVSGAGTTLAPTVGNDLGAESDPSADQLRRIVDGTSAVEFGNGRLVSGTFVVAGRETFVPATSSSPASGTKALVRLVDVASREPALLSVTTGGPLLLTRASQAPTLVAADDLAAIAQIVNTDLVVGSRIRVNGFAALVDERAAQNLPVAARCSTTTTTAAAGSRRSCPGAEGGMSVPVLVPFELGLPSPSPTTTPHPAAAAPDPAYDDSSPQAIAAHFADGHRAWSAFLIPPPFGDCTSGWRRDDSTATSTAADREAGIPAFAELLRCASLSQLPTSGVVAALVMALSARLAHHSQAVGLPAFVGQDHADEPRALDLAFIGPPLCNDALCAQLCSLGVSVSPWAHTAPRGATSAAGAHSSTGTRFGGTVRRERGGQLSSTGGAVLALRDAELLKPADIEALCGSLSGSAAANASPKRHPRPAILLSTTPAATATGSVDKRLLAWVRRASFVVAFEPLPAAANMAARLTRTALERCLADPPAEAPPALLFEPVTPAGDHRTADAAAAASPPGFSASERIRLAEDCSHLRRTLSANGDHAVLPPLTRGAWTLLDGFYKHARRRCSFVDAGLMAHTAYVARVVALLARPFRRQRGDSHGVLVTTVADAAVAVCVVDASLAARFGSSTLAGNLLDSTPLATIADTPSSELPLPDAASFVDQLWALVHAEQTLSVPACPL